MPSASTTAPGLPRTAGQQVGLGDGDRDLVVALLHAEVAGQAAAAGDPGDRRAGALEQPLVGGPADDGVVVAVRLGDHLDPGEVGQRQLLALDELGEAEHVEGARR